jgi:hypothetical protein
LSMAAAHEHPKPPRCNSHHNRRQASAGANSPVPADARGAAFQHSEPLASQQNGRLSFLSAHAAGLLYHRGTAGPQSGENIDSTEEQCALAAEIG